MSVKTVQCSFEEWVGQAFKDILIAIAGLALVEYILDKFRNKPPEQPPKPVVARALPLTAHATISQPTAVVTESKEGKAERKLGRGQF